MVDMTVEHAVVQTSHETLHTIARFFANEAGYDQEVVDEAYDELMTDILKELPPEAVNEIFEDPNLDRFTTNSVPVSSTERPTNNGTTGCAGVSAQEVLKDE